MGLIWSDAFGKQQRSHSMEKQIRIDEVQMDTRLEECEHDIQHIMDLSLVSIPEVCVLYMLIHTYRVCVCECVYV